MSSDYTVIGLDGGASKIRGAVVQISRTGNVPVAQGCGAAYEIAYADYAEKQAPFTPVPLTEQLAQWRENSLLLTAEEKRYGALMITSAAAVVRKLLEPLAPAPVIIGVGMPGLKTVDKRGIAVMANGPRLPLYLDDLGDGLKQMGVRLAAPIHQLGSDADYCGIGEQYSLQGQFRQVATAYYLGVGTGIADAMKLAGSLLPMDQAQDWIAKSWELQGLRGIPFEKCVSMAAVVADYRQLQPQGVPPVAHAGEIFARAAAGEALAAQLVALLANDLAGLVYARIATLALGESPAPLVASRQRPLRSAHPFVGECWHKIIFGQRLGQLWANQRYRHCFHEHLEQALRQWLLQMPMAAAASYLYQDQIRPDLLVASTLTEAPILGAGIAAYLALANGSRT